MLEPNKKGDIVSKKKDVSRGGELKERNDRQKDTMQDRIFSFMSVYSIKVTFYASFECRIIEELFLREKER